MLFSSQDGDVGTIDLYKFRFSSVIFCGMHLIGNSKREHSHDSEIGTVETLI